MKLFFDQRLFVLTLCAGIMLVATGCSNDEEIRSYAVDKPAKVQEENHPESPAADAPAASAMPNSPHASASSKPARMFAAIVPKGDEVWFFKMTGQATAVESLAKSLADFIGTVKYEAGKATWKLPEGWEEKPGNQFRFATLMVPSDAGPLEFTVSKLGNGPEEIPYVVSNINRWRGQLGLGGIKTDDVNKAGEDISQPTSKRKIGEQTVYFVNITRKPSGHVEAPSEKDPTFKMQPPSNPASPAASKPARMFAAIIPRGDDVWFFKMTGQVEAVKALAKPLSDFIGTVKYEAGKATWKLPEGWEEKPGNQFRFATIIVPSSAGPLEFTVSKLGSGPEEVPYVAANINRWRGQLGLEGIQIDDIKKATDDITKPTSKQKIGEQTIYYVNIVGKKSGQAMRPPFAR